MIEISQGINVTCPLSLLEQQRYDMPHRRRKIQLRAALDESAGAWSDEDYPHLMSVEDVDQYVRQLREVAMPRSWDDYVQEMQDNECQTLSHANFTFACHKVEEEKDEDQRGT